MRVRSHQTWLRLLQRDVCLCPARRARLATRPRFYSSENTNAAIPAPASQDAILTDTITTNDQLHLTPEARKRIPGLVRAGFREYPRIKTHHQLISAKDFHATYEGLKKGGLINNTIVTVHGRLSAMRESGSKLVFLDVDQVVKVQGVCHLSKCIKEGEDPEEFKQSLKLLRRGDVIGMTGYPIRTPAGELSVFLTELPTLLSPCLHPLPTQLLDEQTRIQHRHVDLLVHKKAADTLRLRSSIVNWLRQMFRGYGSHEVHTPIMSGFAGGAVARPFQTTATEFGEDRKLELRVAPELWLKRLILGGMDRVFELGPCFRNEG
ncbi:MAG: hypothetical protein M1823_005911 [Watsoniomyces obsoletus]|nr:MAG: hypothetical protein M1823_005911 [Watsoniomyces obsoletus]